MIWFTSDEHYGHQKIIEYSNRPFDSVEEMDQRIIDNHNEVVGKTDLTIHAGDFTLWKNVTGIYEKYVNNLNGYHVFLRGSHDYWLKGRPMHEIWERNVKVKGKNYYFVVCHYAMKTWARSHYNSFQLFGHSHGTLEPVGKQWDVGVDNNNFYPLSGDQIVEIMEKRPDNPNLVRGN